MSTVTELPDAYNPTRIPLAIGGEMVVGLNSLTERELYIGMDMEWNAAGNGQACGAVDPDMLRAAIDKAVGPATTRTPGLRNAIDTAAQTNIYVNFDDTALDATKASEEVGFELLGRISGDGITFNEAPAEKPYRPIDRDRLLRHISDLEATLTRRNERHEEDQERIRELEREIAALDETLHQACEPLTAREHLDLAWEAAYVPEGDEIPEGAGAISKFKDGDLGAWPEGAPHPLPVRGAWGERRLLDPPPTEEEQRRADYEAAGLEEWEIELLMGSDAR